MKSLLLILCLGVGMMLGYSGPPGEPEAETIHQNFAQIVDYADVMPFTSDEQSIEMNQMPVISQRFDRWEIRECLLTEAIEHPDIGLIVLTKNYKFLPEFGASYHYRC